MQDFNKLFLLSLGMLASPAAYAQLGVGTGTTAPRTMLDVNGAVSFTETTYALSGTSPAYTIAATVGQLQLSNGTTPTGTAALNSAASPAPVVGQRLMVFNNSSIPATLNSNVIPAGQTTEFVYSANGWRASTGGGNIYTADGTLAANRTVTQGSNGLTFTGAGALTKLSGATGTASTISVGRTAAEGSLSTLATAGTGTPNTAAGDLALSTGNTTANLVLNTPSGSTGYIGLGTAGSERLRLTSAGYLGLGTNAPGSKMHLLTTGGSGGADDDLIAESYTGTGNTGSAFFFRHARGTQSSPTNLASGDQLLGTVGVGYINGSFLNSSSLVSNYMGNGTNNLSNMVFNASGSERMRIDEKGNIGIGTSTIASTTNNTGTTLEVNSGIANKSGLRLTQLTNSSPTVNTNVSGLGVDANGDVVKIPVSNSQRVANSVSIYKGDSGNLNGENFFAFAVPNVVTDVNKNYTPSTGVYKVPYTGTYLFQVSIRPDDNSQKALGLGIGPVSGFGDGVDFKWDAIGSANGYRYTSSYSLIRYCTAGEQLTMYYYSQGGGARYSNSSFKAVMLSEQ